MNTITQMAHTYRKLCKRVQQADAKILIAKQQVNQLSQARNQIIQEMEHLRVILDYCVLTGASPVQAQLSHTVEQMQAVIQDHRRHHSPDALWYTGGSSTITVNTAGLNQLVLHGMQNQSGALGTSHHAISMLPVTHVASCPDVCDEVDLSGFTHDGSHT